MSTQLQLPTLPTPLMGWFRDVPRWRVQGYRLHAGHLLGRPRPFGALVEWHETRESAEASLDARRQEKWGYVYISTVLVPDTHGTVNLTTGEVTA